jgi:hypothetical protein
MGAMIDAWLLGGLGGQQGCRCQQKYVVMNYGGAFVFDAANAGRGTGCDAGCIYGVMPAGSAGSPISALYARGGPARHAVNHCR